MSVTESYPTQVAPNNSYSSQNSVADETPIEAPTPANTHDEPLTDHNGNPIIAVPVNAPAFVITVHGVPNLK